jgi:hypothetical protein
MSICTQNISLKLYSWYSRRMLALNRIDFGKNWQNELYDDTFTTGTDIQILPADQITVCAGPWSCSVVDWVRQQGDDESTMF